MSLITPLARLARRFRREQKGGVLAWIAVMAVPLMGFTGLAMDTARGYMVKARLQQAIDAAALAGGRIGSANPDAARETVERFFRANFPDGFMETRLSGPVVTVTNEIIRVEASVEIPTAFVHFIGFDTFNISAATEVTKKLVYTDLVISLDVSGSMGDSVAGGRKIDAARNAAKTLVDILFGPNETKELLKIGVVQWDSNVNVTALGSTFSPGGTTTVSVPSFVNPYTGVTQGVTYRANNSLVPLLEPPPTGWRGCVLARFLDDGQANDADVHTGLLRVGTKDWMAFRPIHQYTYTCGRRTCTGTYQCPRDGIQRLVNVKSTVHAALDRVNLPQQNTSLVMGLFWAWQVLDSVAPFTDATVLPPGSEGEVVRAVVLMTDGANTRADGDAYAGNLTASELNSRTTLIATNMKNAGVIIYAIQFDFRDGPQEALMKSVASGPTSPYYQYAPDAAALQTAFQEIGNHLSKLRLSR
jgi:Flp pilus assembly protein TadG